ncbi:MAG: hypothetical protein PHE84_08865 [bacterium]|nr:hypothetical protein [bacterium]
MGKINKNQIVVSLLILTVFLTFCILINLHADESTKIKINDREKLEKKVEGLLKKSVVDIRRDVDDIFLLADIYAEEGKDQKATALYEEALKADSWRLEYQLKLARLLLKQGDKKQAISKAELVVQLAEDENLYNNAYSLLKYLQAVPKEEFKTKEKNENENNVEILVIPLGKINRRLIGEVLEKLQKTTGIDYQMVIPEIDIGNFDRSYADQFLSSEIKDIKKQLSDNQWEEFLTEQKISKEELETNPGKINFLKCFFKKKGIPKEKINEFDEFLHNLMNSGQYDVNRLLDKIKSQYPLDHKSKIKGVLGVTAADIFSCSNNFLFGSASKGYGAFSYHRFTASFNHAPPNRPKLVDRTFKQAISSTFFLFDIPRCTFPTCVRAFPNSLEELDRKSAELCSWCREHLENYLKETRRNGK